MKFLDHQKIFFIFFGFKDIEFLSTKFFDKNDALILDKLTLN
jgi:hypothetical protein